MSSDVPSMMRAIRFPGDRQIEIAKLPRPAPARGQALIRIRASGICGSDLHQFREPASDRSGSRLVVTGHEAAGVVEAVGLDVDDGLVGRRVVAYQIPGCGACQACAAGIPKDCPAGGGMGARVNGSNAEWLVAPAWQCMPLDEHLSWSEGVLLACAFGTAWGAAAKATPLPHGRIVVFGLGPVGLSLVAIAKELGAAVVGVDIVEKRLEFARDLGVDQAINMAAVQDPDGLLQSAGGSFDILFETSGSPRAYEELAGLARRRGRIVLVGLGSAESAGVPSVLMTKEISIAGTWAYDLPDWPTLVEFYGRGRFDPGRLISHHFSPGEAARAFALADSGQTAKVIFDWEGRA